MVEMKEKEFLSRIVEHCVRIEETIDGIDKGTFDNDKNIKDIVCFNIFQIGELAKHLSVEFVSNYHGVPWQKIKGMRDIIGHGYGAIGWDRVWSTAISDIKPLHEYCEQVLNESI